MTRRRSFPRSRSRPAARPSKGSGRLRIIGGEYRRRLLPVLDSPGLRPTPDRVRETLFNWLATATPGARVLDLFAGTGALGLEALSRGAASALFIERDAQVARALADNLHTLDATERGRVQAGDALAFLAAGPSDSTVFSLVFLDPPFRQDLAAPCCERLEQGWLTPEAWVYLETETALDVRVPANWSLHREVRAGDSTGRLYRRLAQPDE
ncbi:16S rRNA (guanine(966)-N(2))-methyltransferase RsmD [Billgrantia tianxiuensis]|jgi:16S rRNA (guanine966-N2)-methyltransferase|uniref:Ribosomal RNA small subunit methyltransferase D n=1 Tax=Billgrantia tianxiuensis TaxID=2497861 RepID=A0A6I6SGT0_9GAMM|nr:MULTISPECIES: 16S rRNA (guanine(966)-N(2))-methyltransferase RsmD [Halomonas]MCE8032955.1 16S rRNA (guanine(966)-N(2))-methyltransferase RsmD [Halomonas sp. MCCC 1A11057]QHC48752.1 16S rRNA (guanine(966)-N(2))-methyltransferase RsmD [Halomonas tianxiuensis]